MSKGSTRRRQQVSMAELDRNWKRTFPSGQKPEGLSENQKSIDERASHVGERKQSQ